MKKVFLFVALTTLAAGTIVSCGKSTKGKMDGDWKLDSYNQSTTSINGSGTSSGTLSIEGTTITQTETNTSGVTTTTTGVVNAATWSIKKDGTWEKELSVTFSGTGFSNTSVTKSSGNWDFEGGVGDFKKNERVVFSTLSNTVTNSQTLGNATATSTTTDTYADGENTDIYTITESKKKSLSLEVKESSTSGTTGGSTTTETLSSTTKLSM